MAASLSIKSDMKSAQRWLNDVQRRQIPYATSRAINDTLKTCRKAVINGIIRRQESKKAWWNNKRSGINIEWSNKHNLTGSVGTRIYWAHLAEHGGIKIPHKGNRNLAIPQPIVPKSRRKSGGVRIMAAQKKTFFNKNGLYRKKGSKKNRSIELLFRFVSRANIKPWMRLRDTAQNAALKSFRKHFDFWLRKALKTAR